MIFDKQVYLRLLFLQFAGEIVIFSLVAGVVLGAAFLIDLSYGGHFKKPKVFFVKEALNYSPANYEDHPESLLVQHYRTEGAEQIISVYGPDKIMITTEAHGDRTKERCTTTATYENLPGHIVQITKGCPAERCANKYDRVNVKTHERSEIWQWCPENLNQAKSYKVYQDHFEVLAYGVKFHQDDFDDEVAFKGDIPWDFFSGYAFDIAPSRAVAATKGDTK